jgi:hypothetical protein
MVVRLSTRGHHSKPRQGDREKVPETELVDSSWVDPPLTTACFPLNSLFLLKLIITVYRKKMSSLTHVSSPRKQSLLPMR